MLGKAEQRLMALAAVQHSAFTLAQALEIGVSADALYRRVAAGRLDLPSPEVFLIPGSPDTWRRRVSVAVLTEGPCALGCVQTAAALWGMRGFVGSSIHVLSPRGKRRRRGDLYVHETCALEPEDMDVVDGIAVTSRVRTLIDLAGRVHPFKVGAALDEERRKGSVTYAAVRERLEELAKPGRNGIRAMRELLDRRPGSDALLDRSGLELAFYDVLVNGGLPPPVLNHPVWIDGQKYVIDIAYPDYKVGAEVLSEERHVDLHHFHYDPARFNILQVRGGWTMLGFTSRRLTEPECVVAEMKAALGI